MSPLDVLNALYGLVPQQGALGQAISPVLPPAIAQQYGGQGTSFWGDLSRAGQGLMQSAPTIGHDLSQLPGQAADSILGSLPTDSPIAQYTVNRLSSGADPYLPDLSQLWQQGMPNQTAQPTAQDPSAIANSYMMGTPQPGDPSSGGDVTDFPGRDGHPSGDIWNSILNGLSGLGGSGSGLYAMTHDPQAQGQFMDQLHKIFGIGKGEQQPQGPGILDQLAGQMNDAQAGANAGAKGKAGSGGGGVTTYGLGQYQEPPAAPHERIPDAIDLGPVMDEIRKAEPQRVPLNVTKGTAILEGIAHGMASGAGHGFGTQLLAGAAGGLSGEVGYAHEQQRDEQNFQRAMQDFHYRVAEGELHKAQIGSEHDKLAAEIDYHNQMNDYQRQLSIIDAHKPQAQMTPEGLVIQQINPKNGQYEIKVDSRPIDHILEARMALKGMGASPMALSSFTSQATGAAGHHAGPADAALNLGVQLLDRPDLWPGLFGDKFQQFNMQVQSVMGKDSAYGTLADDRKGKLGQMQTDVTSSSAIARMLQNAILADPTGEMAKRAVGLLSGQAVIGDKNKVVQNPFGLH